MVDTEPEWRFRYYVGTARSCRLPTNHQGTVRAELRLTADTYTRSELRFGRCPCWRGSALSVAFQSSAGLAGQARPCRCLCLIMRDHSNSGSHLHRHSSEVARLLAVYFFQCLRPTASALAVGIARIREAQTIRSASHFVSTEADQISNLDVHGLHRALRDRLASPRPALLVGAPTL